MSEPETQVFPAVLLSRQGYCVFHKHFVHKVGFFIGTYLAQHPVSVGCKRKGHPDLDLSSRKGHAATSSTNVTQSTYVTQG